jgi:Muconolactone delta-isomerase
MACPSGGNAPTMEYLVTMTTHVPGGTPQEAIDDIRAREAARSRELAACRIRWSSPAASRSATAVSYG